MPIEYLPYTPTVINGQAILNNFQRTRKYLRYKGDGDIESSLERGMPLYETTLKEQVGDSPDGNMLIRGECLTACAYLKKQGIKVDLVYIDPPFASGADYAKKIFLRRNPEKAAEIEQAAQELEDDEFKAFEEKMYGDIWDKERYLNWMYENLCAIKEVMSDNASIYMHLDWNIGHYVKILMDEIFGEENFLNNIVWCYQTRQFSKNYFNRKHHDIFWYAKNINGGYVFNWDVPGVIQQYSDETIIKDKLKDEKGYYRLCGRGIEGSPIKGAKDVDPKWEKEHPELVVRNYLGNGYAPSDYWLIDIVNQSAKERVDYATQKPEALLERIIKASSNEGMVVADFFGGSGVTAAVANRLGRKFIHVDVGVNSIQTARDRLVANKASFSVYEIQDGVSLYRNPVQTMDKIKSLIPHLVNEDGLDKYWEGVINDPKLGKVPVYVPNLTDSTTKILDLPMLDRIMNEAIPDLPPDTAKVIIYFIDSIDLDELKAHYREHSTTLIKVEFRDLKPLLSLKAVLEDDCKFTLTETADGFTITIDKFFSDRIWQKVRDYNERLIAAVINRSKTKKNQLALSDNGLECIELISLDYTNDMESEVWKSDYEIKIGNDSKLIINGEKQNKYWDGTISCEKKPLRIKIRNICGDESVFPVKH